eukprot:2464261-Pleurochrysis_carterae.AAC.1
MAVGGGLVATTTDIAKVRMQLAAAQQRSAAARARNLSTVQALEQRLATAAQIAQRYHERTMIEQALASLEAQRAQEQEMLSELAEVKARRAHARRTFEEELVAREVSAAYEQQLRAERRLEQFDEDGRAALRDSLNRQLAAANEAVEESVSATIGSMQQTHSPLRSSSCPCLAQEAMRRSEEAARHHLDEQARWITDTIPALVRSNVAAAIEKVLAASGKAGTGPGGALHPPEDRDAADAQGA